jgi:hypothetical protein
LGSSRAWKGSSELVLRGSEPVVIAKLARPSVVLLANPDTGVILRRAHVSQLKPYVS